MQRGRAQIRPIVPRYAPIVFPVPRSFARATRTCSCVPMFVCEHAHVAVCVACPLTRPARTTPESHSYCVTFDLVNLLPSSVCCDPVVWLLCNQNKRAGVTRVWMLRRKTNQWTIWIRLRTTCSNRRPSMHVRADLVTHCEFPPMGPFADQRLEIVGWWFNKYLLSVRPWHEQIHIRLQVLRIWTRNCCHLRIGNHVVGYADWCSVERERERKKAKRVIHTSRILFHVIALIKSNELGIMAEGM